MGRAMEPSNWYQQDGNVHFVVKYRENSYRCVVPRGSIEGQFKNDDRQLLFGEECLQVVRQNWKRIEPLVKGLIVSGMAGPDGTVILQIPGLDGEAGLPAPEGSDSPHASGKVGYDLEKDPVRRN
jgi:hypothetical protein